MNSFVRTLVFGLAALCVLLLVCGITVLAGLKARGKISPEIVRDFLLKPEEQAYIVQMKNRPPEMPVVHEQAGLDENKLLADLAEISGARHANALVEELRRRKDSLDERERWIEAREGELRTARTDLVRLASQLQAKRAEIAKAENDAAQERAHFAEMQASEQTRNEVLNTQENARYKEIANLYELQKGDAWQTLRKLEPKEIARILNVMDPKKAAFLLKLAQADAEYQLAVPIHRALMELKPEEPTATQINRMAQLYSYMKPDQVLPYFEGMDPKDVAVMLKTMAEVGGKDKESALLAALAKKDERRAKQVTDLLQPATAQP